MAANCVPALRATRSSLLTPHSSRLTPHSSRLATRDSRLATHDSRLTTYDLRLKRPACIAKAACAHGLSQWLLKISGPPTHDLRCRISVSVRVEGLRALLLLAERTGVGPIGQSRGVRDRGGRRCAVTQVVGAGRREGRDAGQTACRALRRRQADGRCPDRWQRRRIRRIRIAVRVPIRIRVRIRIGRSRAAADGNPEGNGPEVSMAENAERGHHWGILREPNGSIRARRILGCRPASLLDLPTPSCLTRREHCRRSRAAGAKNTRPRRPRPERNSVKIMPSDCGMLRGYAGIQSVRKPKWVLRSPALRISLGCSCILVFCGA